MKNATAVRKKRAYRPNEISAGTNLAFTILFVVLAAATVLPVLLMIVISFSSSESLTMKGYSFFPAEWTLYAYTNLMKTGSSVLYSYLITIFYTAVGTALSLFVMSMYAFVLAHREFKFRKLLSFFTFFPMLFSGGLVPSYILNVRYLHFKDTIWIFLLPGLMSCFNVIILRTFIQTTIPESLFDAVKIDGGSDWTVYRRIVLPLFKAGLATVGMFTVVGRWNDWFTGILYIENPKLVPIMTYLQRIQRNLDFLKNNANMMNSTEAMEALKNIPGESTRMAVTVLAVLPLLISYPFFQKYFVKGMTIGSVKG